MSSVVLHSINIWMYFLTRGTPRGFTVIPEPSEMGYALCVKYVLCHGIHWVPRAPGPKR